MQELRLLLVTALLLCSAIPNGALTLKPAPAPSAAPAPSSTAAAQTASLAANAKDEREKAVPAFQVGAFLLDHANAIVPLLGGDGSHVIQATKLAQQQLQAEAEKYSSLKGADILAGLGRDFPKLEIKRPTFFSGSNDVASSNVGAVQHSATGVSVFPCAIPIGPVGASISATGINVGPTVISISATGVNIQPQGLDVSPNLIVVGPYDTTVAGQALNVAPALITVSPTKEVVNPVGPLKVADAHITETLPALPGPGKNA